MFRTKKKKKMDVKTAGAFHFANFVVVGNSRNFPF